MEGHDRLSTAALWTTAAALAAAVAAPAPAAAGPQVTSTPALGADPVRESAWAGFFRGLPHGAEIDSLNVLLGGADDVRARCGGAADACYLPLPRLIVMPGRSLPGGGFSDGLARHEYGHHLAASSDNAPFTLGLGTKRWFTREHVCQRLLRGELVDDAVEGYERSVAEGFAEAYRVASGGQSHQWIVDAALYPDAAARRAILADVRDPWTGPRTQRLTGRGGSSFTVRPRLDGMVTVRASRPVRLRLTDAAGRRVASGRRTLRYVDCGKRRLRLSVAGASGRVEVTVSTP
jgi:hypothetical protein